MEEDKLFDLWLTLPDGYQVQLMVMRDYPGGRRRRGARMNVYRSRLWIGLEVEAEPLLYRSQEHTDPHVAVDACYSMLLAAAPTVIDSPDALAVAQERVHAHFSAGAGERRRA